MEEASKFLSRAELTVLETINLEGIYKKAFQTSSLKVVREFSHFVWQLKTELSNYRRARLMEGTSDKTRYDLLGDLAKDPLKAEQQLLALQWEKLEELSVGHYSDLSALILYKLKLEILERLWSFDQEVGYARFQQLLNSSSDG
jgi:hypothetical protein